MIDYLALLLEEQREEETDREETGNWNTGAVRVRLFRREEDTEEEWGAAGEKQVSQMLQQTVRTANKPDADASREDRFDSLDWAAGEIKTIQAGLRIKEEPDPGQPEKLYWTDEETVAGGAGWLDRAVRVSLEGMPRPEQTSKVVTLEPGTADQSARRVELRQLDRLVRRDARRFDGGFQLL